MVRDGTEDDFDAIVHMSEKFWAHTRYAEPFDAPHVRSMAAYALQQGLLAVLEIDGAAVGFVAGICGPLLASPGVLNGTEVAWWVEPEHRKGRNGIALVQHIENMARARGVKYWNMIVMQSCEPETGEAIYRRLGYEKSEIAYTRIL